MLSFLTINRTNELYILESPCKILLIRLYSIISLFIKFDLCCNFLSIIRLHYLTSHCGIYSHHLPAGYRMLPYKESTQRIWFYLQIKGQIQFTWWISKDQNVEVYFLAWQHSVSSLQLMRIYSIYNGQLNNALE